MQRFSGGALAGSGSSSSSDAVPACLEGVPPSELSEYTRACDATGVFFVSSDAVPASARLAAARLLRAMTAGRADLLPALATGHTHVAILGEREETTNLSAWSALGTDEAQRKYWGASGSVSIHEFAHTLHLVAMAPIDPTFNGRVDAAYAAAMADGLWQQTYSATNAIGNTWPSPSRGLSASRTYRWVVG